MARSEGFVYRGRSTESIDAHANQSTSSFDKIILDRYPVWKVEKGEHTIRVLPPTWTNTKKYGDYWGLKTFIHRNVGAKNQTYLCLREMKGERCPVCDMANKMEARGNEEEAYQIRAQYIWLAWMIDRDNEKDGPQIWMCPLTLDRKISLRCKNKKTGEAILIDDPENGYDISFHRMGTGLGTKYEGEDVDREPSPIAESQKVQAKWLAFIQDNPLPDCLQFYDAEYIENVLNARVADADADAEDRKPRGGRGSDKAEDQDSETPKRSRAVDEDEAETPRRGRAAARDEDNEPEPPKRRAAEDDDVAEVPRRRRAAVDENEADEPDPPRGKQPRVRSTDEAEDDTTASARAALKSVGKRRPATDEDEEAEPPRRRRQTEDDEPAPRKRRAAEDDD